MSSSAWKNSIPRRQKSTWMLCGPAHAFVLDDRRLLLRQCLAVAEWRRHLVCEYDRLASSGHHLASSDAQSSSCWIAESTTVVCVASRIRSVICALKAKHTAKHKSFALFIKYKAINLQLHHTRYYDYFLSTKQAYNLKHFLNLT